MEKNKTEYEDKLDSFSCLTTLKKAFCVCMYVYFGASSMCIPVEIRNPRSQESL